MTPMEIATQAGREYITPEDVRNAVRHGCPVASIQENVLRCMSGSFGFNIEDKRLTAYLATSEQIHRLKMDENL